MIIILFSRSRDLLLFITGIYTRNNKLLEIESSVILGIILAMMGMTLVVTSHYKLGFYGTYMGDHFGIFLEKRVTSFPFSILDNPMYIGSFMNMLGYGLIMKSMVNVLLSFFALLVYYTFLRFHEEEFTARIYKEKKERGNE